MDQVIINVLVAFLEVGELPGLARLSKWHNDVITRSFQQIGHTYINYGQNGKFQQFIHKLLSGNKDDIVIHFLPQIDKKWLTYAVMETGNEYFIDQCMITPSFDLHLILMAAIEFRREELIKDYFLPVLDGGEGETPWIDGPWNFCFWTMSIVEHKLPLFAGIKSFLFWPSIAYMQNFAAKSGSLNGLKFFTENVQDLFVGRRRVYDAFTIACKHKQFTIIEYIIDNCEKCPNGALGFASDLAKTKNVRLFDKFAKKIELTAWEIFPASIYLETVEYTKSLEAGLPETDKILLLNRALKKAAKINNKELISYLLGIGADGQTLVWYFALEGGVAMLEFRKKYKPNYFSLNMHFPSTLGLYRDKNCIDQAIALGFSIDNAIICDAEKGGANIEDYANYGFDSSRLMYILHFTDVEVIAPILHKLEKIGVSPKTMFKYAVEEDALELLHCIIQSFSPNFTKKEIDAMTQRSCTQGKNLCYFVLSKLYGGVCEHKFGHEKLNFEILEEQDELDEFGFVKPKT